MNARLVLYIVIGSLCALAGVWFLSNHAYVPREVRLPPRGAASYNPLYALELLLREVDARPESRAYLELDAMRPAPNDTIVYLGDVRALGEARTTALLDWVDAGGHLMIAAPRARLDEPGRLFSGLGLRFVATEEPEHCWSRFGEDRPIDATVCGSAYIVADPARVDGGIGPPEAAWLVQQRLGRGLVTVASTLAFLTNGHAGHADDAELVRHLFGPRASSGRTWLIYSADLESLSRMLVVNAWPMLVAAGLALLAALAWLARPLGPRRPDPVPAQRSLLEHVDAAARLLWHAGERRALHAAMRDHVLRRLTRRHPALAGMDEDARAGEVARRAALSPAEVLDALDDASPQTPERFLARIKILLTLRARA